MENIQETSRFLLDFHKLWHIRLYTVYTSCFPQICSTDVLKELKRQNNLDHISVKERSFGFICRMFDPVLVCLLAQAVGKLWGRLAVSQLLESSAFYFGKRWQLRCSQTQVGSCARLQTEAWRGTADQGSLDDCDDSESQGQRQSQTVWALPWGHCTFHLLKISSYSHEYQSHRGWNRNSSIHKDR